MECLKLFFFSFSLTVFYAPFFFFLASVYKDKNGSFYRY